MFHSGTTISSIIIYFDGLSPTGPQANHIGNFVHNPFVIHGNMYKKQPCK